MRSRRRPGRDSREKTAPFRVYPAAPNYRSDEDETLIRILPMRDPDDYSSDPFETEMTLRHSSLGR